MELEFKYIIKKIRFLIFLFFTLSTLSCYTKYSKTDFSMSTYVTIIIFSDNKKNAEKILSECFSLIENLSKQVDRRIETSPIFLLNKKKELTIDDPFVLKTIKLALYSSEFTNGAFDSSIGNIIKLWGIEDGNTKIPSKDTIIKTLKECGYKNVILEGNKIILKNNVSLDLGGIAKETIMLEVADYLKSKNITDYLINGGGDIIVRGLYQGKRLWKIAIQNPFDNDSFIGYLDATNCSIVTSGDYERFFIGNDGKRYHHIIDPATGYPSDTGLHSVTVITKNPLKDDNLSTAGYFVMGALKGLKFTNEHKISAIFISGNKEIPEIGYTNNIQAIKENNENVWHFIVNDFR